MVGNSETTTNDTLYEQGFEPESGDEDIALRRQSLKLNATSKGALPLWGQTTAATITLQPTTRTTATVAAQAGA
ncbi:hypothetical protein ACFX19_043730 [Malus domestica]